MQNKKSLLKRLLFLYVALFLVIITGVVHSLLGDFGRGAADGMEIGARIAQRIQQGDPRKIYLLSDVRLIDDIGQQDPLTVGNIRIDPVITRLNLIVDEPTDNVSPLGIAFHSIGGSPWIYAVTMLLPLFYLAIIVLMILIIHSLRRSIREERTLDRRNVWYLRAIGLLTILSEVVYSLLSRTMNLRAAELLTPDGITVDTSLHLSYSMFIMGLLILFSAEVFAIGRNLSEEQKLTI